MKPVGKEALAELLGILRDRLRIIVLNACFSYRQAEAISEHVDCAIGMSQAIGDEAAIEFAAVFYQAIGHGRSVDVAFRLARNSLQLEGIPEERTPQLLVRSGIDAGRVVLVAPEVARSGSREPGEAVVQLRALGTSYAYQAAPGVNALSVGRQRRKPGGPLQGGNDVVVCIRGDVAQNLRISRRHLDIVRTDHRWYLVDRSRGYTTLNDALVPAGDPVPLRPGDRIGLAGVLVLEFSIRDTFTNSIVTGPVGIGVEDGRAEEVVMEASVGDMVTVRDD